MRLLRRPATAGAAVLLAVALAGCGTDDPEPDADPSPAASSSGAASEEPAESPSQSPSDSPSEAPSQAASDSPSASGAPAADLPAPGTADAPAEVEAVADPLQWRPAGDPERRTVTAGSAYTLSVDAEGGTAALEGPRPRRWTAPRGFRFAEALLDGDHAVVVAQHKAETQPAVATVVDLATGKERRLDGRSDPGTVNGGAWALGQGTLYHATYGRNRAYCLAEVDLGTMAGQTAYCAEPRTGFNQVRTTPEGLSLMSFDDGAPACRTVVSVGEAMLEPFPGVPECRGWEGLLVPGGDVSTTVRNEGRIELSDVRARVGDGYYDLGPAMTGSLVWCGDAAYFSRQPETDTGPSQVLRWDGRSLAVVLEAGEGGASTPSAPRCGGDRLAVSVLAERGDQQLTAPVG